MNSRKTWHDPVVAETHAVREQLAKQYKNDLGAFSKATSERCQNLGFAVVEPAPIRRHLTRA
jgi:hypothetical protein